MDTNVLIFAANHRSPYHARSSELLDTWRKQASSWHITWGICYEFLRVVTHPQVFRSPWSAVEGWDFLEGVLTSPGLGILIETERHATVAAEVMREIPDLCGNLMHDAQTAVLMREHGIRRIYTRDTDFHRFPFLEVVDPLAEKS